MRAMNGMSHDFLWRSNLKWPDLVQVGERVIKRWNSVTQFTTTTDSREHIWMVRHNSVAQPFMIFNEDVMRGSIPRSGNPLAFLLLLGICIEQPNAVELSFANGKKIDPTKFELDDLTGLLPQATHAAHRKLAALAMQI